MSPIEVIFLYYEDCPSHEQALERLRAVMQQEGMQAEVKVIKVETEEAAQRLRFVGSPTILVNGQDIDSPSAGAHYGLTCRAYRLENGRISPMPSVNMIRRALRKATSSHSNK